MTHDNEILSEPSTQSSEKAASESLEYIQYVSLSKIVVSPYQPRRAFQISDLEELAQSIRAVGLIHPPLVRPIPGTDIFELISGERRLRAAQMIDLPTIPVYIRKTTPSTAAQAALIENIQRVDLNPIEIAKGLKRLIEECFLTQEQLASKIGKKRSTVANYIRLLLLPQIIQDSITHNIISMGHAKAILSIADEKEQLALHTSIIEKKLNVREAEYAASCVGKKRKNEQQDPSKRDLHVEELTKKMREKFGTAVSIQAKSNHKGRISIDYYNLDDLDRLLLILGVSYE